MARIEPKGYSKGGNLRKKKRLVVTGRRKVPSFEQPSVDQKFSAQEFLKALCSA